MTVPDDPTSFDFPRLSQLPSLVVAHHWQQFYRDELARQEQASRPLVPLLAHFNAQAQLKVDELRRAAWRRTAGLDEPLVVKQWGAYDATECLIPITTRRATA